LPNSRITTLDLKNEAGVLHVFRQKIINIIYQSSFTCMSNYFSLVRKQKKAAEKLLAWLMAFSLIFQLSGVAPLVAYATEVQPLKIVASKIVCDDESKLPNWGLGGPDITANTAANYVATHSGCQLVSDWKFQWGYGPKSGETGVLNVSGSFTGEANGSAGVGTNTGTGYSDWKTFGPTNSNGKAEVSISDLKGSTKIWVREVLKDGYVPFSYYPGHTTNDNNVSAEMYCASDVLNYDNYDYVNAPVLGSTYHCVAFNVLKTQPPNTPPTQCTAPVDVMIVLDRSGSMASDGGNPAQPLGAARSAANTFINSLSAAVDRAGAVTYNDSATLNSALSSDLSAVKTSYASVSAGGYTNIGAAIDKADNELRTNGRNDTKHVIVLLSDGRPNRPVDESTGTQYAKTQASEAKSAGEVIYTIGLGTDANPTLMKQLASLPDYYYYAPSGGDLNSIYAAIAAKECQRDPATISGKKINDKNANGAVNDNEGGLSGWQITLTSVADASISLSETTGQGGSYEFSDVVAGSYKLCEVAQNGWSQTSPSPATNNGCYVVTVASGESLTGKNFLNTEDFVPECRDEKDNDGDGKIDYPEDPGCDGPNDNSENQPPVITVIAPDPLVVTLGGTYTDPGATANDTEDGNITPSIIVAGDPVDPNVVGAYTVTYNVTDSNGAAAVEKTRTVTVAPACSDGKDNDGDGFIDFPNDSGCENADDNDENKRPTIELLGNVIMSLAINSSYIDAGANANDAEDCAALSQGDCNVALDLTATGAVNTAVLGSYQIEYNAVDSKGLTAIPKTRTVTVTSACSDGVDNDGDGMIDFPNDLGCTSPEDNDENTKPVITLTAPNPLNIFQNAPFSEPGFGAADPEDGDITVKVVVTGLVDTSTIGSYTLTYNVTDSEGLAADTVTRTVNVNPPLTECNDGVDNDGDGKIDFPEDTGCDSSDDNSENQPPVITLRDANPFAVTIGSTYTEPSADVDDSEDGDIDANLVISGDTVNPNTLGAYVVKYNAVDSKGAAATEKTRIVNVVSACSDGVDNDGDGMIDFPNDLGCTSPEDNDENEKPVITLTGDAVITLTVNTAFIDPSATAADPEDGNITDDIVKTGTVDTSTVGSYTITYNVTDSDGAAADPKTRTVNVVPEETPPPPPPPTCTENCGGGSSTFDYWGCTAPSATNYNRLANKDDGSCQYPGGGGGGGGTTPLVITNEKLTSVDDTTVTVTWNTNIPADSRVVYGLDPVVTLGAAPLYGYGLTTATDATASTSHSMTISGIPSGASAYFRPISSAAPQTTNGIELTRGAVLGEVAECYYLREYMRLGYNNNPVEVTKLQLFLRDFEGFKDLQVTGFFDITTDRAVRIFQDRYKADVLDTWNLPSNTGYVYYTTQKKVNEIYCKRMFPLNETQLTEISQFRKLMDKTKQAMAATSAGTLAVMPKSAPALNNDEQNDNTASGSGAKNGVLSGVSLSVNDAQNGGIPDENLREHPRVTIDDLLATAPELGNVLESSTATDEGDELAMASDNKGEVLGANDEKGVAAAIGTIASRANVSEPMLFLIFLAILTAFLGGIYFLTRAARGDKMEETMS
jgi:uncharacterized protein YegL